MSNAQSWHWSIDAAAKAPIPAGRASSLLFAHGSMEIRYYAPRGGDKQTPHDQDEVYVIATGSGWFRREDARVRFGPGDLLFVAAGEMHRFEDFSEDFGTWVVFYGPQGGEKT
jgi:mannose-6-phosphate isomerase-like protein (cupin superfamily)